MKIRFALALVLLAAASRIFPHPDNFSPIAAMGLFGAAYFQRRWMMVLVPFAGLFFSDLFLNNVVYKQFYPGFTWYTSLWVYAAFAMVILVGWAILHGRIRAERVIAASLLASVIFFLVTNFSVWQGSGMYSHTWAGLLGCYAAGLPFFTNTILGDLCFSALLFGTYEWVTRRIAVPVKAV
ncbi:MAG: DUF6580 family putative transport protein [Saprospiraceae bacterium]